MKRIVLLTALAAMMAAAMALSGVAQAGPISGKADVQCFKLARQTLGPSFKPGTDNFVGDTEGIDNPTGQATEGPDVFCGFGGDDQIDTLNVGDIFLGGEGMDIVSINAGTFNGDAGNDHVSFNDGTFVGGPGDDSVGSGNPPSDD